MHRQVLQAGFKPRQWTEVVHNGFLEIFAAKDDTRGECGYSNLYAKEWSAVSITGREDEI